jgi:large subunit ribosomal protein L24
MKFKKGDKVKIIKGKDAGKTGKIIQVFPERNKVVVEGQNIYIKNVRPKKQGEKGQKIEFPAAMQSANVRLVCPKCNKPVRIGYKILTGESKKKKVRQCRKCQEVIE